MAITEESGQKKVAIEERSTATQLAQLDMCRSAKQGVTGSNRGRTNTQGLKTIAENVLPLL